MMLGMLPGMSMPPETTRLSRAKSSWLFDMRGPTSAAASVALSSTAESELIQKRASGGSLATYSSTMGLKPPPNSTRATTKR
jgi:hypothetical protein